MKLGTLGTRELLFSLIIPLHVISMSSLKQRVLLNQFREKKKNEKGQNRNRVLYRPPNVFRTQFRSFSRNRKKPQGKYLNFMGNFTCNNIDLKNLVNDPEYEPFIELVRNNIFHQFVNEPTR